MKYAGCDLFHRQPTLYLLRLLDTMTCKELKGLRRSTMIISIAAIQ